MNEETCILFELGQDVLGVAKSLLLLMLVVLLFSLV